MSTYYYMNGITLSPPAKLAACDRCFQVKKSRTESRGQHPAKLAAGAEPRLVLQLTTLESVSSSSESVNNKFLRFGRVCRMSKARRLRSDMSCPWQLVSSYQNGQKGRSIPSRCSCSVKTPHTRIGMCPRLWKIKGTYAGCQST